MHSDDRDSHPLLRTIRLVPTRSLLPQPSQPRSVPGPSSSRSVTSSAPRQRLKVATSGHTPITSAPPSNVSRDRRAVLTALYAGSQRDEARVAVPLEPTTPARSMLSMNVVRGTLQGYDPTFSALPWEQPSWSAPPPPAVSEPHHQHSVGRSGPPLTPLSHHQRQTLSELAEVDRRLELLCGGPVSPAQGRQSTQPAHSRQLPTFTTRTPPKWGVPGHLTRHVFDTAAPISTRTPSATICQTPTTHVRPLDLELLNDV